MADVFQDQMGLFPEARVILTVRDSPEKWAASWKVLVEFIRVQERPFSLWRPYFYPTFIQWIPFMRNWKRMRDMMGVHLGLRPGQLVRGCMSEPDGWLEKQYEAHNQLVEDTVPKDKLLMFNVKEGWDPLCEFLEKEVPQEPFPNVNESKDLKQATTIMKVVSYAWLPLFLGSIGCLSAVVTKSIFRKSK